MFREWGLQLPSRCLTFKSHRFRPLHHRGHATLLRSNGTGEDLTDQWTAEQAALDKVDFTTHIPIAFWPYVVPRLKFNMRLKRDCCPHSKNYFSVI